MPTRLDIRFTGRVQGVGFRYSTQRVAAGHDVRGWVRNEPDGTVRCVVEGDAQELQRFVRSVQEAMESNITRTDITEVPPTGEALEGFSIRS